MYKRIRSPDHISLPSIVWKFPPNKSISHGRTSAKSIVNQALENRLLPRRTRISGLTPNSMSAHCLSTSTYRAGRHGSLDIVVPHRRIATVLVEERLVEAQRSICGELEAEEGRTSSYTGLPWLSSPRGFDIR